MHGYPKNTIYMKNNKKPTQKLICAKCNKIIVETENLLKLKEICIENYIECPYCNFQHLNPLLIEKNKNE